MTPDDITRLADKIRAACESAAKNGFDIPLWEVGAWEAELRTLAQQGKAGGVAEGFVLMPKTPTNEITEAMAAASEDPNNERSSWDLAENMYRAGINAAIAPQPKDAT